MAISITIIAIIRIITTTTISSAIITITVLKE